MPQTSPMVRFGGTFAGLLLIASACSSPSTPGGGNFVWPDANDVSITTDTTQADSGGTTSDDAIPADANGNTDDAADDVGGDDTAVAQDTATDAASNCKPTDPPTEACDNIDNDCNGQTDDGACDDGNPCTDQACDGSKAAQDEDGCTYSLPVGTPCDDESACTVNDSCLNGICQPGEVKDCNDSNSCTIDKCKAATGACENSFIGEGKFCNDGLGCTNDDKCTDGKCVGKANSSCDDGVPCTLDTCDAVGACKHETLSSGPCEDGNPCTTDDKCFQGFCTPGNLTVCDDSKPCTDDYCDAQAGGCVHKPKFAGTACSQGLCATGGFCDEFGGCIGLKLQCDDNKKCTVDTCDSNTGACTHTANPAGTPCDDGEACTVGETCDAGGDCKAPAGQKGCNDGNPCTQDVCDIATQSCSYKVIIGACDDGDGCTTGEVCAGGTCKVGPSPDVVSIAGNGTAKYADGKGETAQFSDPRGMAMTSNGVILLADSGNHRIRRVKSDGYSDNFAGIGTLGWQDGPSSIVRFSSPSDVAITAGGSVLVADKGNHRIRSCTGDGTTSTLAGSGTAGFLDGAAATARFSSPEGVAVDAAGDIYVADTANHRIRKISAAGIVSTVCGSGTAGFADGVGVSAQLSSPTDIVVTASGAVLIADSANHRIRRLIGEKLETFAGNGTAGWVDDVAAKAQFKSPWALFEDVHGRVLVVEAGNHTLRSIKGGTVETIAGVGQAGFKDGPGGTAQFSKPQGVIADKDGKAFVADGGNHRIRTAAASQKLCNDGNPCTNDLCDKGTGACIFDTLKPGDACDDGSACTVSDTCDFAGTCKGQGKNCDDGSPCTDDSCNAISGQCETKNLVKTCDDGDACTTGDTCVGGACVSGAGDIATVAGSGSASSGDGKGTAASFYYPEDVAVDAASNAYIADTTNSRIRKITADGVVTTLVGTAGAGYTDGPGNLARVNTPAGVAVDSKGVIYVADRGNHRIRKILADGTTSTFAGNGSAAYADGKGVNAKFYAPQGIDVDPNGNVYVADTSNQRIRKIDKDGVVTTVAGSGVAGFQDGPSKDAKFYQPYDVVFSPKGDLFVADYSNHRIRRIDPAGTVSTLAGSGTSGTSDGIGEKATFSGPSGLTIDANGNLLVVTRIGHRLRRVTPGGDTTTLAGGTAGWKDGAPTGAQLNSPAGADMGPDGTVFIADRNNHRIRKMVTTKVICADGQPCTVDACNKTTGKCSFTAIAAGGSCSDSNGCTSGETCDASGACTGGKPKSCNDNNACTLDSCNPFSGDCVYAPTDGLCSDGQFCTINDSCQGGACVGDQRDVYTLAGQASAGVLDGKGSAAKFYTPQGIDADTAGNVWVTDYSGHSIRRVSAKGSVETMAGNVSAGYLDGKGTAARFNTPSGIVSDGAGGAFIADRGNHRIRHVSGDGTVTTFAGSGSASAINGKGTAAAFYYPEGITRTGDGTIYIGDTYNHRIRKIDKDANVTILAGSGSATWKDGVGTAASFYYPRGLDVDAAGNIYVADTSNHRIRKIDAQGNVTTVAGSGTSGFADGKGALANFASPYDLAAMADGTLWISDTSNHRLRQITVDGTVSTIAGATAGWLDESAALSLFSSPRGVTLDDHGNGFVADSSNQRIRKLASPFNDCDDGTECTTNACDEVKDVCSAINVKDGSGCIDGKPCLANRLCNQGFCVGGVPKVCDDNNSCSIDSCDAATGDCIFKADVAQGCSAARRVFVTSETFNGNMQGLNGAHQRCQLAADKAGLGGTWLAWGSAYVSGFVTPSSTFNKSTVPYRRIDGALVALNWNDLVDGKLDNPIEVNEFGDKLVSTTTSVVCGAGAAPLVWTGTTTAGLQYDASSSALYYCSQWQTNTTSTSYRLGTGRATATDASWTQACTGHRCNELAHLYCFEQSDSWFKN